MKHAVVFSTFGTLLAVWGVWLGGFGWLLLWPAGSFLLIGGAYAHLGPRVCGKRADGRLAWWAVLLLLPYLLMTWTVWHVIRLLSRETCCDEVAPGVWVGRRPFVRDLPANISLIVDLTAEFPAPRSPAPWADLSVRSHPGRHRSRRSRPSRRRGQNRRVERRGLYSLRPGPCPLRDDRRRGVDPSRPRRRRRAGGDDDAEGAARHSPGEIAAAIARTHGACWPCDPLLKLFRNSMRSPSGRG